MVVAQTVLKPFAATPVVELQWPARQSQPVAAAQLSVVVLLAAVEQVVVVMPAVLRSQQCWELTPAQSLDQCFAEVQQSPGSSR